jgi:hypothetical protein
MRELTNFQKQYFESLRKEEMVELEKHIEQINAFKKLFSQLGIHLTDDNFRYYPNSGIIVTYPNIISYLHDTLKKDKEGLLSFKSLTQVFEKRIFADGYFYGQNFMLMASPYFRRGLQQANSFAPRFIELFWKFQDPNIDAYISLDSDSVRINVDNRMLIELDTWYGAQFKKNIADIADGLVKLRPPLYIDESDVFVFFANAYSLDIKWETKNNIKSFQAEEFKTEKTSLLKDGNEYYPVRYIHAEYDIDKGYFRHFDGAIHFYTADEYYRRRDSDFNHNSKGSSHIKTLSQKLFKMNGIIPVETWVNFTSHFLTGNPLVFEYFEGEYPQHLKETLKKIRALL